MRKRKNKLGVIRLSNRQAMFINDVLRGTTSLEYDTRWLLKSILDDGYYSSSHRSILNNVADAVRNRRYSNQCTTDDIYNYRLPNIYIS